MSNVFSFTGVVGRDAEVRRIPSGQAVLNVTVANNIGFGDRQQTIWVRVAVWGKRAEGSLVDYLKKGQHVFVSGELSTREYQANDGTTKTSIEVNANILDLIGGRKDDEQKPAQGAQNNSNQQKPQAQRTGAPNFASGSTNGNTGAQPNYDDFDDDIPF